MRGHGRRTTGAGEGAALPARRGGVAHRPVRRPGERRRVLRRERRLAREPAGRARTRTAACSPTCSPSTCPGRGILLPDAGFLAWVDLSAYRVGRQSRAAGSCARRRWRCTTDRCSARRASGTCASTSAARRSCCARPSRASARSSRGDQLAAAPAAHAGRECASGEHLGSALRLGDGRGGRAHLPRGDAGARRDDRDADRERRPGRRCALRGRFRRDARDERHRNGGGRAPGATGPARGRPLYAAVALFVLGLVIAGLAATMPMLVVGRLVQGLGAGGQTVALYVVVARVYPPEMHGRVFAAFSAAWVVPSLVGPFLAGAVTEYLHWRWVFLGVAAAHGDRLHDGRRATARTAAAHRRSVRTRRARSAARVRRRRGRRCTGAQPRGRGSGRGRGWSVAASVVVIAVAVRPLLPRRHAARRHGACRA